MNWEQFKNKVDSKLKKLDVDPEAIEIDWIDITDGEVFNVNIICGSDDRISMQIDN